MTIQQPYRRIAFISEHANPMALLGGQDAGGQNVYVDEVSRHLARLGYAVDVFTRRESPTAPPICDWAPGVRVVQLAAGPADMLSKDVLWPYMPAFRDELLRFAGEHSVRYDVLHGNFWMSGWVAADLRRRLGIPAVQIFHALGKTKQCHQGSADTSPASRIAVEHAVIAGVDRIIAQCPAEQRELIDDYNAPRERLAVIPSAVNTEQFRPVPQCEARRRIGIDANELVAVYVGRMLPRKDVRTLVRAAALLLADGGLPRPLRLLLVGGETSDADPLMTPEIGELQRLAAELGISAHITFTGKRQPAELCHYYSAGDVVVTSPWYEPFGLTPLEGMACGRPVIGSAVGGITYTIEDGVTGLLVPPRDPERLAASLFALLTQPARRAQMGVAAREHVERRFTWPTVARRTADLYATLWEHAAPAARPAARARRRSHVALASAASSEAAGV